MINVQSVPATKALQVTTNLIVTIISLQDRESLLLFTKCNSCCSLQKCIFILSAANTN